MAAMAVAAPSPKSHTLAAVAPQSPGSSVSHRLKLACTWKVSLGVGDIQLRGGQGDRAQAHPILPPPRPLPGGLELSWALPVFPGRWKSETQWPTFSSL